MKKLKKLKLISLVLGVFIALTAFGCTTPVIPVTEDTLQIAIYKKGYGSDFADALAKAYSDKTGVDAKLTYITSSPDGIDSKIPIASSGIDVVFDISGRYNAALAVNNYFNGYEKAYADLTSVYDAPADPAYAEVQANSSLKNRDIINETLVDMLANDKDGKNYVMPWVMDLTGIVLNKTIWERDAAKLGNPEIPKTTDEMFTLFDKIKNTSGTPYAFKYGGQNTYVGEFNSITWLAQYEGKDNMENIYQGKDGNGIYTPEIFNSPAREKAFEVVRKMLLKTNGYVHTYDSASHIFMSQIQFLEGGAYFCTNGSWLEREVLEDNFDQGEVEIEFIKTPVLSAIVDKWPAVFTGNGGTTKDEKLRAVLDYIDGDTLTKPSFLSGSAGDAILAHLTDARRTESSLAPIHYAYIPAYSKHIDEAKKFLRFALSKEGQEVMLKASFGNMFPLNVDPSQFDYYKSSDISSFAKSTMAIFQNSILAARSAKYPMVYRGGIDLVRLNATPEIAFGGSDPVGVSAFMQAEFNFYNSNWSDRMSWAAVSNP